MHSFFSHGAQATQPALCIGFSGRTHGNKEKTAVHPAMHRKCLLGRGHSNPLTTDNGGRNLCRSLSVVEGRVDPPANDAILLSH